MALPTYEDVSDVLLCDEKNGVLYWKVSAKTGFKYSVLAHAVGDVAGCLRKDGRVVVRLFGALYLAHRLIWLLTTKEWPSGEIDHINGIPSDNRIKNLRVVTRGVNQQNLRVANLTKTTSRFLGVYIDKRKKNKKWRAAISLNGKQKSLGYYLTEEEAYAAYVGAKRVLHTGCTI